jgi:hypothetical protein
MKKFELKQLIRECLKEGQEEDAAVQRAANKNMYGGQSNMGFSADNKLNPNIIKVDKRTLEKISELLGEAINSAGDNLGRDGEYISDKLVAVDDLVDKLLGL